MAKKISILLFLLIIPIFVFSADKPQIDPDKFYVWHGFESDTSGWSVEDWKDNMFFEPAVSTDFVSEGKQSLEFKCNARSKNQEGMIQLFDSGDLRPVKEIKIDLYNSTLSGMKVQLMVKTGANWLLQQTVPVEVKPGWNRDITINFDNGYQLNNSGEFNNPISGKDNVRRLGLLFKPTGAAQGFIAMDNIRIRGDAGIQALLPEEAPKNLKEVLIDHFEKGFNKWSAAAGWTCASGVEMVKDTDGKGVMKAKFNMNKPGQNAAFVTEGSFDLSDVYYFKLDIYNPNDFSMNASLALSTGDKWTWQEGPTVKVNKGWNRGVKFNLKKKEWKSELSGWRSVITPADITQVKRISILLYPPDMGEGYALIDDITMETTNPDKLDNLVPADLGELSYRVWNSFEKGIGWQPDSDASGAMAVNPISDFGGEKNKGMEIKYSMQNNVDKASYSFFGRMDFSDAAGVKFDIYNPAAFGVKISIAFKTGSNQVWIESKQVGIAPGWNKGVLFDFITPSFKSATSNWNFTDYFSNRNDVREFIIQVYPDAKVASSLDFTDFKLARRNFIGPIGNIIGATFANNTVVTAEPVVYKTWDEGSSEGTFETAAALNYWKFDSTDMAGWGPVNVSISDKFASKGKKSLRLDYKDAGNKFGVEYVRGPNTTDVFDISNKSFLAFDLYNPGKVMKLAVAFKTADANNSWYESKQIIIKPGWNKNIKMNLDSPEWKDAANGWVNSDTIKNKTLVHMITFMFYNGIEGSVYMDNVRWGYKDTAALGHDSQGNFNTGNGITDFNVEQDVNLYFTPNDNVEGKVTLRAAYYNGQNNELSVQSGHVILRGLGNEFTAFAGENTKPFDDVFGLIDPASQGSNVMGVSLAGTLYPINTSYMLMGMSMDAAEPWKLGTTFVSGARLKTYFLDKDYLGAIFMNNRRGYDANANPFTGEVEQSANIYGGDTAIYLPWQGVLDMTLKGEVLYSQYATAAPVYIMYTPTLVPISQDLSDTSKNLLIYGETGIHFGYLTVSAFYRDIGANFAAAYANPDYGVGNREIDAKATYIMDTVFPFNVIGNINSGFSTFVHYTQLMVEYGTNHSIASTYKRDTYTIDLKNDESLALYNYHIWWKYNNEGDPTPFPNTSISGVTKILAGDMLTFRLLGRYEALRGNLYEAGSYSLMDYAKVTGFVEASLKLSKQIKFTGSYKFLSSDTTPHGNWYAELEANLVGSFNIILGYGVQPFTGYWLDDNNDDTLTRFTLAFKGYF
jgi:hypothetical protein